MSMFNYTMITFIVYIFKVEGIQNRTVLFSTKYTRIAKKISFTINYVIEYVKIVNEYNKIKYLK